MHFSVKVSHQGRQSQCDVKKGISANADPHEQKLRTRVTHIWGNRRGQLLRSAMEQPRPEGTTSVIMVITCAR